MAARSGSVLWLISDRHPAWASCESPTLPATASPLSTAPTAPAQRAAILGQHEPCRMMPPSAPPAVRERQRGRQKESGRNRRPPATPVPTDCKRSRAHVGVDVIRRFEANATRLGKVSYRCWRRTTAAVGLYRRPSESPTAHHAQPLQWLQTREPRRGQYPSARFASAARSRAILIDSGDDG